MSAVRVASVSVGVLVAWLGSAGCGGDAGQQMMQPIGSAAGAGAGGIAAGGMGGAPGGGMGGAAAMPGPAGTGAGNSGAIAGEGASGSSGESGGAGAAGEAGGAGTAGGGGAAEPPSCPATSTLRPGDSNGTIDVGGMRRTYIVHVPAGYDGSTAVPLLIDWHPLTQTASYQRRSSGYAAVADREGFIVVYPDGIDAAWNIGPCCTRSRDVDDLGLARALVEKISNEACIDPKRVYAAGFSMGGGMSHYLGCEAADVFAAIAPAAFDLIEENIPGCQPARPITVISFRGTSDFIVPYAGGESTPPTLYPLDPIHFLGAVGTFQKWAELNQCTGEPTPGTGGCQTYTQCAQGVEVTLCTSSGGHQTGNAEIGWEMLKKHPMP